MANVISSDGNTLLHYLHSGFSTTISDSYSVPDLYPKSVTWDGANVISNDSNTDLHYLHAGFSSTITSSYNAPAATCYGVTWDDSNVISSDTNSDLHYLHSGFSSTISDSYSSPSTAPYGVTWDARWTSIPVSASDDATLEDAAGVIAELAAQEDSASIADVLGARSGVVGMLSEQVGHTDALAGIEVMAEATDTESLEDDVGITAALVLGGETASPVDSVDSVTAEAWVVEGATLAEVAEPSIFQWPMPRSSKGGRFRACQPVRGEFCPYQEYKGEFYV